MAWGPQRRQRVGKQVPIVYQPGKPEQAILDTALGTWLIPTVILVVGVVVFLVGLIGFLFDIGLLAVPSE